MRALISVVICTYNRAEILRGALESIICQKTDGNFSYEIVVIDDGSTDNTSSVVNEVASRSQYLVKYVREESHGIAHARNIGISESRGEWIAWFDDDQLAEPDWLYQLFAVASRTRTDCIGGNRVLALPSESTVPLSRVTRSFLGELIFREESRICSRKSLPPTGNMLIKRSVLDSVGWFDTSMLSSGEDYDLVLRIWARGFKFWSAPKAVLYHLIPAYRLSDEYFRWVSCRAGRYIAFINNKQWGRGKTLLLCIARIGQAILVNMPMLVWAYLLGDRADLFGRKYRLWIAVAYTRETLFLLAPRLFAQKRFFAAVEFRKERTSFTERR